jgi:hypothetical protein
MPDTIAAARRRSDRLVQVTFAAISLCTLVAGLAINWFAVYLGLPAEVVETAAFGMLLTAAAHAAALWLWDRR